MFRCYLDIIKWNKTVDQYDNNLWHCQLNKPEDLKKFSQVGEFQKELADKFFNYYGSVFKDGELTAREKSLIALAVAHAIQCPYCIDAYSEESLEKGATEGQMMEAVHVATAIRGGASLVHGVQMMNKVKDLTM